MRPERQVLLLAQSTKEFPISYERSFKFHSSADALAGLQQVLEAAWWVVENDLSLQLEDRCLSLRLRWPQADEDQTGALRFAAEVDKIPRYFTQNYGLNRTFLKGITMKPERIKNPLKTLPGWSYHQTDELRRHFTLESYEDALNFVVGLIELAEDLKQEPEFSVNDRLVSVQLAIPSEGTSAAMADFVPQLEKLRRERG